LGGSDPADAGQGVLIIVLQGAQGPRVIPTPTKSGDVTITLVRDALVCFRTTSGGLDTLNVDRFAFDASPGALSSCST
jgi:hypothetical protein